MYIATLTPLAKIFQPKYHTLLSKNPSLVYDEDMDFEVKFVNSYGDWIFKYKQPRMVAATPNKKTEIDWIFFQEYLIGGESGKDNYDTDSLGLVKIPVDVDIMGLIANAMDGGKAAPKNAQAEIRKGMDIARKNSETRVRTAIRRVYDNLQDQYAKNKEAKLGNYVPSPTEYLCAFVLAAEVKQSRKEMEVLTSKFADLMQESNIASDVQTMEDPA